MRVARVPALRAASPPIDPESCSIEQFYDWLEVSMEVLECCGRIWGELNAKVSTQALAAGFCALVPAGDASRKVGRANFRVMKDGGVRLAFSQRPRAFAPLGPGKQFHAGLLQIARSPPCMCGGSLCCCSGNVPLLLALRVLPALLLLSARVLLSE